MKLIFSWPGYPRGRRKIERFFRMVEQMLLPRLPGFVGENGKTGGTCLSLSTGSSPQQLTFGICDTYTVDNSGSFSITIKGTSAQS